MQSPQQRRADYSCLKDILVVELKTLEGDGTERVENFNDELRSRADYPAFYGEVPVESLLKNLSDPETVRHKLTDRVGRAIVSHLRKANKQLAAHAQQFPRKNLVRLAVIVNEDHPLYEPNVVMFIVQRALAKQSGSKFVYENIDAVVFMTERHATNYQGNITLPIVTVYGHGIEVDPWKGMFVRRFTEGWAAWNGKSVHDNVAGADQFEPIDHIPEQMKLNEFWRLEYRRNPYLNARTDDQIRSQFDESIVTSMLSMVKDSPIRPTQAQVTDNMRLFTHVLEEINRRGIPMRNLAYSLERALVAARRLRMPQQVLDWLMETDRFRTSKGQNP